MANKFRQIDPLNEKCRNLSNDYLRSDECNTICFLHSWDFFDTVVFRRVLQLLGHGRRRGFSQDLSPQWDTKCNLQMRPRRMTKLRHSAYSVEAVSPLAVACAVTLPAAREGPSPKDIKNGSDEKVLMNDAWAKRKARKRWTEISLSSRSLCVKHAISSGNLAVSTHHTSFVLTRATLLTCIKSFDISQSYNSTLVLTNRRPELSPHFPLTLKA